MTNRRATTLSWISDRRALVHAFETQNGTNKSSKEPNGIGSSRIASEVIRDDPFLFYRDVPRFVGTPPGAGKPPSEGTGKALNHGPRNATRPSPATAGMRMK